MGPALCKIPQWMPDNYRPPQKDTTSMRSHTSRPYPVNISPVGDSLLRDAKITTLNRPPSNPSLILENNDPIPERKLPTDSFDVSGSSKHETDNHQKAVEDVIQKSQILHLGVFAGEPGLLHAISDTGTLLHFPTYDNIEDLYRAFWTIGEHALEGTEVIISYPSANRIFEHHRAGTNDIVAYFLLQSCRKISIVLTSGFWERWTTHDSINRYLRRENILCSLLAAREQEYLTIFLEAHPLESFKEDFCRVVRPFDLENGPQASPYWDTLGLPLNPTTFPHFRGRSHVASYRITFAIIRPRDAASASLLSSFLAKSNVRPPRKPRQRPDQNTSLLSLEMKLDTTSILAYVLQSREAADVKSRDLPWKNPRKAFLPYCHPNPFSNEILQASQRMVFGFSDVGRRDRKVEEQCGVFDWEKLSGRRKRRTVVVEEEVAPDELQMK